MHEQPMEKDSDLWYCFSSLMNEFNNIQNNLVQSSYAKVLDELMSALHPRTLKNGFLPNISYIIRKPKPLGTEFKTVCYPSTGIIIRLEIQRGKYCKYFNT